MKNAETHKNASSVVRVLKTRHRTSYAEVKEATGLPEADLKKAFSFLMEHGHLYFDKSGYWLSIEEPSIATWLIGAKIPNEDFTEILENMAVKSLEFKDGVFYLSAEKFRAFAEKGETFTEIKLIATIINT